MRTPLEPLTVTNPFDPFRAPEPLRPLAVEPLQQRQPDEALTGARSMAPAPSGGMLTGAPSPFASPAVGGPMTGVNHSGPLIPDLVRIARLVTARDPHPVKRPSVTAGHQTPFDATQPSEQEIRVLTLDCGS